jgi:hypothetical protein
MTRKLLYIFIIACLAGACKAKKCPTFDGDNAKHHVKYDKKGHVKKKKSPGNRTDYGQ